MELGGLQNIQTLYLIKTEQDEISDDENVFSISLGSLWSSGGQRLYSTVIKFQLHSIQNLLLNWMAAHVAPITGALPDV